MSKPRLSKSPKAEMAKAYEDGELTASIALRFGVNPSYPSLLAKRRKLKPRTRSVWTAPPAGNEGGAA
jgi:transposase-like protein